MKISKEEFKKAIEDFWANAIIAHNEILKSIKECELSNNIPKSENEESKPTQDELN